jgi:hypothetical protein
MNLRPSPRQRELIDRARRLRSSASRGTRARAR